MEERLIDSGLGGDLLHARTGGAAADEHGARRIENARLRLAIVGRRADAADANDFFATPALLVHSV